MALNATTMAGSVIGGAALGLIDKMLGDSMPTIPVIGRAGTIALGAYFFARGRGGIMRDVAIAGASIAGYQLGKEGTIAGEYDVQGIAAQV